MKIKETNIPGVIIIEPEVYKDHRGWFFENWSSLKYEKIGIKCTFVQDNHSLSKSKHTLRGLHFQLFPKAQAKLVRCSKGLILDIAVDLRPDSPTFKKWVQAELSESNFRQLFIPKGFAHGFLTLTADCEVQYKTDEYYSPQHDRTLAWNDPEINIQWGDISPILSDKDKNAPSLEKLLPELGNLSQ